MSGHRHLSGLTLFRLCYSNQGVSLQILEQNDLLCHLNIWYLNHMNNFKWTKKCELSTCINGFNYEWFTMKTFINSASDIERINNYLPGYLFLIFSSPRISNKLTSLIDPAIPQILKQVPVLILQGLICSTSDDWHFSIWNWCSNFCYYIKFCKNNNENYFSSL